MQNIRIDYEIAFSKNWIGVGVMREKMNVQYVIADAASDKILYIKKTEVDHSEVSSIGKQALSLQKEYRNAYVMIKMY